MNTSTKPIILILSNTQIDIEEVISSIVEESYDIYSSTNEDQALELFSAHRPTVVIFNYEALGDSQRIYLDIYRNGQNTKSVPHSALLLCKVTDAKAAFELCMRQVFDDYVIFKPLYDPNRLRLTLRYSSERLVLREESGVRQQQLSKFSQEAGAVCTLMDDALSQGHTANSNVHATYTTLKDSVMQRLDELTLTLTSEEAVGSLQQLPPETLRKQLRELTEKAVVGEFQKADVEFKKIQSLWLDKLAQEFKQHRGSIRELDAVVKAIPKKILIVEDDALYSKMLETILKSADYAVKCAFDGESALRMLVASQPDIILLDYELPDMTGVEFIHRSKVLGTGHPLPIIMLTGHSERGVVHSTIAAGACDYIVKPASRELILKKVETHLCKL